jgi:integrase
MFYPTMWNRNGTYWLRRVVPLNLREALGQTEIRKSLGTRDPQEAARRWKIESLRVDDLFERARRGVVVQPTLPRMSEADREIVRDYYTDKLVAHDEGDIRLPDHVRNRYLAIVQDDGSPRVSEVLDRWIQERRPSSKTESEWRKSWSRFIALGLDGQDLPIRQVTKAHARKLKDRLLVSKGRHMSATISPATATKIIGAVKSVMQWATNNGIIDLNPCAGISVAGAKQAAVEKARLPYDKDDLKLLFGQEALKKRTTAAQRWLPWLALYTGARLEELGQLHTADVKEEDGISYLNLSRGDGKKLKTAGSARRVPIHPELERIGFMEYVASVKSTSLFPELRRDTHGALTGMFSKWYGRHQRALGITDKRKSSTPSVMPGSTLRGTSWKKNTATRSPDTRTVAVSVGLTGLAYRFADSRRA